MKSIHWKDHKILSDHTVFTVLYLSPLNDELQSWVHLTDCLQTNCHDRFVVLLSQSNLQLRPQEYLLYKCTKSL